MIPREVTFGGGREKYFSTLSLLDLSFFAASSSGCATYYLSDYDGYYSTVQAIERAVILHDGRVVIDFSKNEGLDYYYKRVYFRPDDFVPVKEQATEEINKLSDSLVSRIVQYAESANGDSEKGRWELLDYRQQRVLPAIPEQDTNSACMNFHKNIDNRNTVRHSGYQLFEICDEIKHKKSMWTVQYEYEKKRSLLYYPAQLLYIPALAIDIITLPIQIPVFLYVRESISRMSL